MSYNNREMTITVKREEFLASINVLKDIERKLGELKLKAEKKEILEKLKNEEDLEKGIKNHPIGDKDIPEKIDRITLMRLEGYAYNIGCYLRDLFGEEWLKDTKE